MKVQSVSNINEMLDLFYANKHLNEKIVAKENKRKVKSISIKMNELAKVYLFSELAATVNGDIWAERDGWRVNCRSTMGLMAINLSDGAVITYPASAEGTRFEDFLKEFQVR